MIWSYLGICIIIIIIIIVVAAVVTIRRRETISLTKAVGMNIEVMFNSSMLLMELF